MHAHFTFWFIALLLVFFIALGLVILIALARRSERSHRVTTSGAAATAEAANHPEISQLREKLEGLESEIRGLQEQLRFLEGMLGRRE